MERLLGEAGRIGVIVERVFCSSYLRARARRRAESLREQKVNVLARVRFGDGRRRVFGGQASNHAPPKNWARGEPVILSSPLTAGITMGLVVVGAALAA